jgi:hypothetical protein
MGAVCARGASEDELAGFVAEGLGKLALLADRMRWAQGEVADALAAGAAPLARALAAAARQVEAALQRLGTASARYFAMMLGCYAHDLYNALASMCGARRAAGAPDLAPAALAQLCNAAAPVLDAAAACLENRRGVATLLLRELKPLETLRLLMCDPFSVAARRALRSGVLTPARFSRVGVVVLAAELAEQGRVARLALPPSELAGALKSIIDCAFVVGGVRGVHCGAATADDASALPASEPGLVCTCASLLVLSLCQTAAAADAGDAVDFAELAKVAVSATACLRTLVARDVPDAPPPPASAPWALIRVAVASAAVMRCFNERDMQGLRSLSGALIGDVCHLAGALLRAGRAAGVAESFGAVSAALGAACARARGAPHLEALTRHAGVPLAGARVGLARCGGMELSAESLGVEWPTGDSRACVAGLYAAIAAVPTEFEAGGPEAAALETLAGPVTAALAAWHLWE